MHIDHVTLRTKFLKETKNFLLKVFDLKEGERPARILNGIDGYWLYHKDAPLIHLIQSYADDRIAVHQAGEAIDHCGFFMENYSAFKTKLTTLHIPFSLMDLPEIGERRIFLHTPTGILLETVFRESEDDLKP